MAGCNGDLHGTGLPLCACFVHAIIMQVVEITGSTELLALWLGLVLHLVRYAAAAVIVLWTQLAGAVVLDVTRTFLPMP
jgi:hypothetical protein